VKNIILIFFISYYSYALDTTQLLTEIWTPYQMETEEGLEGISIDLVKEIQRRVGNTKKIQVTSWNRGYDLTLNKKGYALFLTTKSEERDKHFKWVGPISSMKLVFFKNKQRKDLNILSLDDAKKVNSIIVAKKTIEIEKLTEFGFENLEINSLANYSFKKLYDNKVDLYPVEYYGFLYKLKKLGLEEKIVPVKMKNPIFESQLYIAFNISTEDEVIKLWQDALNEIQKDGTYLKILNRYK
jgi:polar amino acid transport system substrate-binding protein